MTRIAWIVLVGQLVAAIGSGLQWLAAPQYLPPGLIYIAGAIVILLLERRSRWASMGAVAMSAWIFYGGLNSGSLTRGLSSTKDIVAVGNWVMVAGLVVSVIAAVVAMTVTRSSEPQVGQRTAVTVTSSGLLVYAVGNAWMGGWDLSRPGPIPFAVLALLVALVRYRFMVMISIVMSIAFLEGTVSRLSSVGFGSAALMMAGLVMALVAGVVAVVPQRTAQPASG
ncbi:hypothetical protein [Kibdelosporangium aridum]|uniref:Uncharacterized protein n=1 Tax=Kibdelosporangium aridum TaxID=2030 RepID=A0A1Y5Y425_KIBAR|nr:hypothetical protein [Kibdelosporangium aridum]SMD22955.1 hypothetical protein SAMN05661093_07736 [Kibdelosporangium aridum]